MAVAADIPVNLAGIHIPFAPAARQPVQDRMGGGSFATRMESERAAPNAEESADPRRAADPYTNTPRDARGAELMAAQIRVELAKQRQDAAVKARKDAHSKKTPEEAENGKFTASLERRLSSLLGDVRASQPNLHYEV